MNSLNLRYYPLVKLSLSVVIFMGVSVQSRADTLYGPLKSGETLSSIVNENYLVSPFEDGVIMREIFRLNPQAFIYNNMGLVKQGVMLTLPSDETIRRSQGQGSSALVTSVAPAATQQIAQDTSALTRSLNETLTQVRNERDQAKVELKRLQSESESQAEVLNARIEQLGSDNQSTVRQLSEIQSEVTQLKQSLELVRQENIELSEKAQIVTASADADSAFTSQLEDRERLLNQKQLQITELEATISELKGTAEGVNNAHETAIAKLRESYTALEAKLDQQVQANSIDVNSSFTESNVKIDELKLEHQQALSDLKASFDAEIAEKSSLQASLKSEIDAAKLSISSSEAELSDLKKRNSELELAFSGSLAANESLGEKEVAVKSTGTIGLTETGTIETLLKGPVTKELLVQEIEKPVAFPLWGLLLGSFALGFTSLMVLFTRSRKPIVQALEKNIAVDNKIEPTIKASAADEKEALVFRAAAENALPEPDIETLRVPPRRDPSRVAILDPSMVASAATASSLNSKESREPLKPQEIVEEVSTLTPHQSTEAKLKLLLAETYAEINDISAANELLDEVQQEGDEEHLIAADALLARINQG